MLKKGVPTALPPLYVTVLFRDLRTVEPLKRMIENQSVKIEGEVVADVRLTMIEKLALHTQHPTVEIALYQEVPAALGLSVLERTVALTTLGLIDSGLQATSSAGQFIPGAPGVDSRSGDQCAGQSLCRGIQLRADPGGSGVPGGFALTGLPRWPPARW